MHIVPSELPSDLATFDNQYKYLGDKANHAYVFVRISQFLSNKAAFTRYIITIKGFWLYGFTNFIP